MQISQRQTSDCAAKRLLLVVLLDVLREAQDLI